MRRFGSEPAKKSGQNIPKNRCRTTIAEPIGENANGTALYRGSGRLLLSHDQAGGEAGRREPRRAEIEFINEGAASTGGGRRYPAKGDGIYSYLLPRLIPQSINI